MQSDEEKEKSLRIFPELTVLIQQRFPQSRIAADQEYRICDLAIDFAEDVGPLPLREAHEIAALMQSFGMSAKVSSIHVNGWFGEYDKLSTTLSLATRRLGLSGETLNQSSIYIGDSPNDSPLFRFFDRSIGVSNVNQYGDLLELCRNISVHNLLRGDLPKPFGLCFRGRTLKSPRRYSLQDRG